MDSNRKNFPQEIKTTKRLNHLDSKFFCSDSGILLCQWQDKKAKTPVVVVSTNFVKELTDVTSKHGKVVNQPTIIHFYNESMNGCDRLDQLVSYNNNLHRKTVKWWKRMFHWILEVIQSNAYILFLLLRPREGKRMALKEFKKILVKELTDKAVLLQPSNAHSVRHRQSNGLTLLRFNENTNLIRYVAEDRNCVVCSTPAKRRRTNFICIGCEHEPHLHPKHCFELYHTKGSYCL